MGDSLKAAAEYYEEQHQNSPEFAQNKKRIEEWNKLLEQALKLRVGEFTVSELLFFLKAHPKRADGGRDWVYDSDLNELRSMVGSIVDRIAKLADE